MTSLFRPLPLAVVCITLASVAAAQPPVRRNPAEMLKRADANGDGKVTRDEFIKARTADAEAAFARLDTDGDGTLDDKELTAAAERGRPGGAGERRPDGEWPTRPDGERPRRPDGERPQRADGERPQRADGERPQRADGERPQRADGERPQRPGPGAGGAEAFNRLDHDGDGRLSREEFDEGMAQLRGAMQRGGAGPGQPDRGGRGPAEGFRKPPQQD
jgi:hypothetical protein